MAEYRMTLVDRRQVASDTMAFWFGPDDGYFEFRAEQHVDVAFAQPKPGSENDNFRTFSLANAPQENKPIMIAMRMRKTVFKNALQSAGLGEDDMKVEEFGDYKLYGNVEQHDPSAIGRHSDSGL
jgi:ferredoxin-NADP reductase